MKRVSGNLLELYAAIYLDIVAYDPGMAKDSERDLSRLSLLVASRGLRVLTIDLPSLGKSLDKALSRGYLLPTDIPGNILGKSRGGYPTLFGSLYKHIFDEDGYILDQPDPNWILFLRQILYLCKKVRLECSKENIHAAVEEFRQIEENILSPNLPWDGDVLLPDDITSSGIQSFTDLGTSRYQRDQLSFWKPEGPLSPRPLLIYLQTVCDRVACEFPMLDTLSIVPRHGKKAVADLRTGSDKYLFPHWPNKLEGLFPHEYFAFANTIHFLEEGALENEKSSFVNEPAAKLIAVPKTQKSPRLIASEPTCHQYIQQGVLKWFRKNLPRSLRTCIDFRSQKPSQKAALAASVDGSLATIDLSSASDRLSCWCVERVFRRNPSILQAIHACRTRMVRNRIPDTTPFQLRLKKYANQGSAVTFPLQTIVYALCAIAVVLFEEDVEINSASIRRAAGRIRVYGDDIIVPTQHAWSLGHLLSDLGLKVNGSKTHVSGLFRESCGMDAYGGSNVTPTYILSPGPNGTAEGLTSILESSNNFHKAGLWHAAEYLLGWVNERERKLIPVSPKPQPTISLYTFNSKGVKLPKRSRWNSFHQVKEYRCLSVTNKNHREGRDSWKSFLQFCLEGPDGPQELDEIDWDSTPWSSGWISKKGTRKRVQWVSLVA
jgi:hypothetical protein